MWQNFVHLKIKSNLDVAQDEFLFIRTKDGADVTQEMNLDKHNTASKFAGFFRNNYVCNYKYIR